MYHSENASIYTEEIIEVEIISLETSFADYKTVV